MSKSDMHSDSKRFLRPISYGIATGVAACFLLLIVMSVTISLRDIPHSMISLTAMLSFIVGGFVSGYVSAVFAREKGMLLGIICGGILYIVLCIASFAAQSCTFGMAALTKLMAVLFAAALGGVIGVNKRKKFR